MQHVYELQFLISGKCTRMSAASIFLFFLPHVEVSQLVKQV